MFKTRLAPITFELRDFATTGEAGNAYALRAASVNDERFSWDGTFETTPFTSRGQFEVANLRATTLWSYLRDALPFELTSGMINLQGGYEFAARDSGLKLNVKNVTATDLALHGPDQPADDVKLAKLSITNTRFDLRQRRVDVEKMSLSGAALRARRDEQGSINLLALLGEDESAPAAEAARAAATEAAPAWVLNAPDIAIEGASMDVEDGLVKPAATFKLAPIDVKVSGYSNAPGTQVQIDAAVGIDGNAKLAAKGEVVLDTAAVVRARGSRRFQSRLDAAVSRHVHADDAVERHARCRTRSQAQRSECARHRRHGRRREAAHRRQRAASRNSSPGTGCV